MSETEVRQPDGDVVVGDWIVAPLWSKIDEGAGAPNGTYIVCPANKNSIGECSVENPSKPGTYTQVDIKVYARKSIAGGNQRGLDADIRVEGALQEQKTLQVNLIENFVEYTQSWAGFNFSQGQMNSLRVLFISTGTTGGRPANRREVDIDYYETVLTYTVGEKGKGKPSISVQAMAAGFI